ncbi:protein of unknown function (DUF4538) [Popillia japonica]|uniref:Small integral membrane protein 20 n=1 Tax=Popillia japonica TaxID=7064 RepID=A0AAW1M217_POPJA
MALLIGWRFGALIGGLVGLIGLAVYPAVIYPMLHIDEYKEIQKQNRKGLKQEDIQPGNMKVWSDPFDRKK